MRMLLLPCLLLSACAPGVQALNGGPTAGSELAPGLAVVSAAPTSPAPAVSMAPSGADAPSTPSSAPPSTSAPATSPALTPPPAGSPVTGPRVEFGRRAIPVEVADTPALRERGLSGRKGLFDDTGMVLYFDTPQLVRIWMPDMQFPLDVVFVSQGKVLDVAENVPPCESTDDCPPFGPDAAVDYVLEVPAGSVARWGLKVNDGIQLVR